MKNLQIAVTGAGGFLGNNIHQKFIKTYNVSKIKLKNKKDIIVFINNLKKKKYNFVINCAASLKPRNDWDHFINSRLPRIFNYIISKYSKKTKLYHISTINILNLELNDAYTISKRKAEHYLINTETVIIRPNMILSKKKEGPSKILHNYLEKKLPLYFMFKKGNSYKPIKIDDFINELEIIISNNNNNTIYNIQGESIKNIWDIFFDINKKYKKIIIPINISFIKYLFPQFVKRALNKSKHFQHLNENDIFI